jgi:hypothetical protein
LLLDSNEVHSLSRGSSTSEDVSCKPHYVLRGHQVKKKETNSASTSRTPITYVYNKQFSDENVGKHFNSN